jgi:hypothetical protein
VRNRHGDLPIGLERRKLHQPFWYVKNNLLVYHRYTTRLPPGRAF